LAGIEGLWYFGSTAGAGNWSGRIIYCFLFIVDYWYFAKGQPSNAVMAVLGIFGNERMKIIEVTI
jgi:hypothetical protein